MTHRLIIARLKKHPGIWRVDGIGEIRDRGRLGKHTIVYLAGIKDSYIDNAYVKEALNGQVKALPIHCAQLTRFKEGSVWRDGKLIRFSPEISDFYEVDVSRPRTVKLDEEFQIDNELIPTVLPHKYYWFGENKKLSNRNLLENMRFVVVPAKKDGSNKKDDPNTWLIIPCFELLRFYFGVSSRLLAGTLAGELEDYISFEDSKIEDGQVTIFAKKNLSRFEAGVLARTVASSDAKTSMHKAHNFISAASTRNKMRNSDNDEKESLDVLASFPFGDKTNLAISGKKILLSSDNSPKIWGIFVMQIWHCSHSFGFKNNPIIEMENNSRSASKNESSSSSGNHRDNFLSDETFPDVEEVPANAKARRMSIMTSSNQFGGMDNVRFEHKNRFLDTRNRGRNSNAVDIYTDAFTFEDGTYSDDAKGNQGINVSTSQVDNIGRDQSLFIDAIAEIRKLKPNWKIDTPIFNENRSTVSRSFLTQLPQHISGVRSWHLIDGRPRQVAAVQIEIDAKKFLYLLEMELRAEENGQCTILLFEKGFEQIEPENMSKFFRLSARNRRWIGSDVEINRPEDKNEVESYLNTHQANRLRHPSRGQKTDPETKRKTIVEISPLIWAEDLIVNIENFV